MKLFTRILSCTLMGSVLFSAQIFAKPPEHAQNKKMKKAKKQKKLPYGLQKKLERGGELPPGWKKKLKVGSVVSEDVLSNGKILDPKVLGDIPNTTYSKIYKIQDKIIRINNATKVILDVLK